MKKSTLIIILVIYFGSIAIINFFGLNVKTYNELINVSAIKCINKTDKTTEVIEENGIKTLKIKFDEPADPIKLTGTMLQLEWRVEPDNASKKDVEFSYAPKTNKVTFYKDEKGRDTGLILFSGPTMITITITSTDGMRISTSVIVYVYA